VNICCSEVFSECKKQKLDNKCDENDISDNESIFHDGIYNGVYPPSVGSALVRPTWLTSVATT
jgi:hypothetical protein